MSYNVRDPVIEEKLRRISSGIGRQLPQGWGFMLMIFSFNEEPEGESDLFYMSSANREDVIRTMKAWIKRNEH